MSRTAVTVGATEGAGDQQGTSRDVARNIGAFALAQISVRILGLLAVVVVARQLTKEDFGRYSVALALSSMLTLVVESGMGGYLVREGTQDPRRTPVRLGHVLMIQIAGGAVVLCLCALIAWVLGYEHKTFLAVMFLAASLILVIVQRSLMAVLVSLNHARASAHFQSAQALVQGLMTVAAALMGAGVVGISAAVLLSSIISIPFAIWLLDRHWGGRVRFSREGLWETVHVSAAYSAGKLGNTLLTYIDAVMVQAIKGNIAAAQYGASYRLMLALKMFPLIYTDALSQPAARLAKEDRRALAELVTRSTSQLLVVGLPIAIGGYLLAEPLTTTVFGQQYAPAASTMALLLLGIAVSFPGQIPIIVSLALGRERRVAVTFGITVLVNVGLNAVLIPLYGPKGAAAAMLVSSVVLSGQALLIMWSEGIRLALRVRAAKAAAATAVMGVVVSLTDGLPLFATIVLGAIVYLTAIVALRTLDLEDLRMLPMGGRIASLVERRSRRRDALRPAPASHDG